MDWLNNLGTFIAAQPPALVAAALTGSVTFVAGMLSQVLSHHFTKKREMEKSLKEAITHLHSPLSIEIYHYLLHRGKFLDPLSLSEEDYEKLKKALDDSWDKIAKILENNTQFTTLELAHNFRQTIHSFRDDIPFFLSFFEEFIEISKKVGFKAKTRNYTVEELLYLLKFHQLVTFRYGERAGLYTFQIMDFHSMSFKRVYKQLKKEKVKKYDVNRNSFDDKFKTLVLDRLSTLDKKGWEKYIEKDLPRRKAYQYQPY